MAPHQKDRETGRLYVAATAEIARLVDLCESVHDRLLRGDPDTVLLSRLEEGWRGANATGEAALPTAEDLRETELDLSDDFPHTEAAANGLRHTEWRRAGAERIGRGDG